MIVAPLSASAIPTGEQVHYTVIAEDGVGTADAAAAITRAGGTIVSRNDDVGMFSVQATSAFAQAAIDAPELIGAATDRAIGQVPDAAVKRDAVEQEGARTAAGGNGKLVAAAAAGAEPLDSLQWNMAMVRANDAHAKQAGSRSVTGRHHRQRHRREPPGPRPQPRSGAVPQLRTRHAGHRRAV